MEKISECVRPLSDGEARQRVAGLAMCFVNQLERVQRLPIGEREVYHRVCRRQFQRSRYDPREQSGLSLPFDRED